MKFSNEDFFSKCDQINFLSIWSHLLTKSSMENFNFSAMKKSSTCARQMLCLDYSSLQEKRNISKLHMIVRGHLFLVYGLGNECT